MPSPEEMDVQKENRPVNLAAERDRKQKSKGTSRIRNVRTLGRDGSLRNSCRRRAEGLGYQIGGSGKRIEMGVFEREKETARACSREKERRACGWEGGERGCMERRAQERERRRDRERTREGQSERGAEQGGKEERERGSEYARVRVHSGPCGLIPPSSSSRIFLSSRPARR
ncbi:hypothetical protein KM043_005977 [Ampulex compressa]|nr:hypothetical protein KM043_005977 [Ampulex compressa]